MAQCKNEINAEDGSVFYCLLDEGHEGNHAFEKTQDWCPLCERTEVKPSTAGARHETERT